VDIDPQELANCLLRGDLHHESLEVSRLLRYVWARVGLDYGILLLVGEDHIDGIDRLICTVQDDGSCYAVERPPGWSLEDEAKYVGPVKEMLGRERL